MADQLASSQAAGQWQAAQTIQITPHLQGPGTRWQADGRPLEAPRPGPPANASLGTECHVVWLKAAMELWCQRAWREPRNV